MITGLTIDDIWRKYVPLAHHDQPAIAWARGEGVFVFEESGRRYLDFISANYAAPLGHGHPAIRDAIEEVLRAGLFASYLFPNRWHAELAALLVKVVPACEPKRALLLTSGGEAVDAAIRACRCWSRCRGGRPYRVACFERAFHGRTLGAWTASDSGCERCGGCYTDGDVLRLPFPESAELPDALKAHHAELACVLMEPYQSRTGRFFPQKFVEALRAWCTQRRVPLIVDEVQSGFARTGRLFAIEHYGIVPDLMVLGKGLGGGLPVSALVGHERILNAIPRGGATTTHGGNPVCAAAALACVRYLVQNDVARRVDKLGEFVAARLDRLRANPASGLVEHAGRGLVHALHFRAEGALAARVVEGAIARGLLLFAPIGDEKRTVKLCPPLVITETELTTGLDILEQAVLAAGGGA